MSEIKVNGVFSIDNYSTNDLAYAGALSGIVAAGAASATGNGVLSLSLYIDNALAGKVHASLRPDKPTHVAFMCGSIASGGAGASEDTRIDGDDSITMLKYEASEDTETAVTKVVMEVSGKLEKFNLGDTSAVMSKYFNAGGTGVGAIDTSSKANQTVLLTGLCRVYSLSPGRGHVSAESNAAE